MRWRSASGSGVSQEKQSPSPLNSEQTWPASAACAASKLARDALGQPGHVRAAERGEGNFLVRAVNRHRLQRRLLGQRVRDRAREAMPGLALGRGTIFRRCVHVRLMDSIPRGAARCKRRTDLAGAVFHFLTQSLKSYETLGHPDRSDLRAGAVAADRAGHPRSPLPIGESTT